jgi:MFS family permease
MIETPERSGISMSMQPYHRVWGFSALGWASLYMTRMIFTPALPLIIDEYKISYTQAGTLASAVFWAYVPMMLISGYLGDRVGRKFMIGLGLFLWSLLCLLTPLAFSLGSLFLFRFLMGFVQGTYFGNDRAMLTALSPPEKWGTAQGFTMMGTGLGNFLALFLGALAVGAIGWRYIFIFAGGASLFLTFLYVKLVPSPREEGRESAKAERFPLRNILFRQNLLLLYLIGFIVMTVFWIFGIWVPLIFMELGIKSPMAASLYGSIYALGGIPGMLTFGCLTDFFGKRWRIQRRTLMFFTLALTAVILLVTGLCYRPGLDLTVSCLLVGILGFFIAGLWPPLYAIIAESAPPKALGTVFGLSNSLAFLGAILAPILMGILKDRTDSFIGGFYIGAGAMLGAAFLTLAVSRRKKVKI